MEINTNPIFEPVFFQLPTKKASISLFDDDFPEKFVKDNTLNLNEEEGVDSKNFYERRLSNFGSIKTIISAAEEDCRLKITVLDGSDFGDIPAKYVVPIMDEYDFYAVGTCIDRRIIPGFKYKVRPIDSLKYCSKYLFNEKALRLQSIGRGYSRRITFAAPSGHLTNNDNYFWTDSRPYGFAFQIEVVSVGDRYTLYGSNCHPIGHLEVIRLQAPQLEISSNLLLEDKTVKKEVKVSFLAEVEWYYKNEVSVILVTGIANCLKPFNGIANVTNIVNATMGVNSKKTYTLTPGIDNKKRCILVSGAVCRDVPFDFTIIGLETYEMPVIGTFVHPNIIPGFYYRVRPVISNDHLFNGDALLLQSIGMGYSKRITFQPYQNQHNNNLNFFWTDSWPGGFGFEIRAIHVGTWMNLSTETQIIGYASVFRIDKPQYEKKQLLVASPDGTVIIKYVHVDITCNVSLNMDSGKTEAVGEGMYDDHITRISGTAVLAKYPRKREAILIRIEDVGLESHLNLLFLNQHSDLILYPTDKTAVRMNSAR